MKTRLPPRPRQRGGIEARVQTALARHWPEYLMEAGELGAFMLSACLFGVLLGHPSSIVVVALPDPLARRVLMGLAMGGTAVAIVSSPFGQQSGGHLNPAFTLTFFRLGKIAAWDACFYVAAQFAGGLAGVLVAALVLGAPIMHPDVNFVVTTPGSLGTAVAFAAEAAISFVMMLAVLTLGNRPALARFTPLAAGALVAMAIAFEAPLSGMSMNPARTFASALPAHVWSAAWIYFLAPPLGMLAAAEAYVRAADVARVRCAKLHHHNARRCIFRCDAGALAEPSRG
jgi:aquaporin Z